MKSQNNSNSERHIHFFFNAKMELDLLFIEVFCFSLSKVLWAMAELNPNTRLCVTQAGDNVNEVLVWDCVRCVPHFTSALVVPHLTSTKDDANEPGEEYDVRTTFSSDGSAIAATFTTGAVAARSSRKANDAEQTQVAVFSTATGRLLVNFSLQNSASAVEDYFLLTPASAPVALIAVLRSDGAIAIHSSSGKSTTVEATVPSLKRKGLQQQQTCFVALSLTRVEVAASFFALTAGGSVLRVLVDVTEDGQSELVTEHEVVAQVDLEEIGVVGTANSSPAMAVLSSKQTESEAEPLVVFNRDCHGSMWLIDCTKSFLPTLLQCTPVQAATPCTPSTPSQKKKKSGSKKAAVCEAPISSVTILSEHSIFCSLKNGTVMQYMSLNRATTDTIEAVCEEPIELPEGFSVVTSSHFSEGAGHAVVVEKGGVMRFARFGGVSTAAYPTASDVFAALWTTISSDFEASSRASQRDGSKILAATELAEDDLGAAFELGANRRAVVCVWPFSSKLWYKVAAPFSLHTSAYKAAPSAYTTLLAEVLSCDDARSMEIVVATPWHPTLLRNALKKVTAVCALRLFRVCVERITNSSNRTGDLNFVRGATSVASFAVHIATLRTQLGIEIPKETLHMLAAALRCCRDIAPTFVSCSARILSMLPKQISVKRRSGAHRVDATYGETQCADLMDSLQKSLCEELGGGPACDFSSPLCHHQPKQTGRKKGGGGDEISVGVAEWYTLGTQQHRDVCTEIYERPLLTKEN